MISAHTKTLSADSASSVTVNVVSSDRFISSLSSGSVSSVPTVLCQGKVRPSDRVVYGLLGAGESRAGSPVESEPTDRAPVHQQRRLTRTFHEESFGVHHLSRSHLHDLWSCPRHAPS